jgi:hypothetical protein
VKLWTFCSWEVIFSNLRESNGSVKRYDIRKTFSNVPKRYTPQKRLYETVKKKKRIREGSKKSKSNPKLKISSSNMTLSSKLLPEISMLKIVKQ